MDIDAAYKRFMQAYDYLTDSRIITKQVELVTTLGYTETAISCALKNKDRRFNSKFLKKFAIAYSDYINEDWLLTGEGEMINLSRTMRPHVEAKAVAGFMDGLSMGEYGDNQLPLIPGFSDYTFTIKAQGNSMLPRIEDGDMLICRMLTDRLNPPIGKICVIDTKEGWVVKVIESVNEDTITLHSLNPTYRDYQIDLSAILGIAEVVGLVRSFV